MLRDSFAGPGAAPRERMLHRRVDGRFAEACSVVEAPPTAVVLHLVQWRHGSLPWGWLHLALGGRGIAPSAGMRFARALGSGREGGFGLVPSLHRHGLVAFFDRAQQAHDYARTSSLLAQRHLRARESLVAVLSVRSSRGSWGGVPLAAPASDTGMRVGATAVASLTRAAIRLRHAPRFWRHARATQDGVRAAPGCRLAMGLGEAPLLRQATFSVWDDETALVAYARSGAHDVAARGAWRDTWFAESMFVRFDVLHLEGCWHGCTFA